MNNHMDKSIKACVDVTFDQEPLPYSSMGRQAMRALPAPSRFLGLKPNFWRAGRTLRVKFLDGDPQVHEKVKHYANEWTKYGNLKFQFISDGPAEIRISFIEGAGSWSAVGTDALGEINQTQPTMNYGWLTPDSPEEEFATVILHEFGHVCGLTHEHENPHGGIKWNKERVYQDLSGPPNKWDKETIDHNMFSRYDENIIIYSQFDPKSIMIYPIPKEWTLDGRSIELENTDLSENDKEFMKISYRR